MNCTPKVGQYDILKNKGVHFHVNEKNEEAVHREIQATSSRRYEKEQAESTGDGKQI